LPNTIANVSHPSANSFFRPLIPLLLFLIGGIVLGSEFPGHEFWAWGAVSVGGCFGLFCVGRKRAALFTPAILFVGLGYLSLQPWMSPRYPANHILHYADTHRWDIVGQIETRPRASKNRTKFVLSVAALKGEHQLQAVTGKLRVTAWGDLPDLGPGDRIQFASRIRSITNFKNPGGFDYKRYMAFKGIWATAYVKGDRLKVLERQPADSFSRIIEHTRDKFDLLIASSGHSQAQAVLKALIIGDRSMISAETRQAFNRAGVGHLLAISGLHIGIVATVAFVFFHSLMVRINPLLWRAWTRKGAALLALLPVLAYGTIAGWSPSTQRAVIMVSLFLMTFLLESEQDSFNTLALAALVILIVNPASLFSISFQLSFSAVLAIIYGFSQLPRRTAEQKINSLKNWGLRFKKWLLGFVMVSVFAICGSLPLVAFYFNQISLIGLGVNVLIVPLVGFIAVPLGLAALFVLPISPTLAFWCVKAGSGILTMSLKMIHFFADLPFAAVKTVTPSVLEIGCIYILGWALLKLASLQRDWVEDLQESIGGAAPNDGLRLDGLLSRLKVGKGRLRRILQNLALTRAAQRNVVKTIILLALVVLTADTCYWLYQRFWHKDLRATIIDVGHGSASLLELPGGHTILIDGGGFADNSTFDVGARIIAPFLWRKKIRSVDALILSHPNSDHLNGLIYIAEHFNVKKVWTNNETRSTLGYLNFMKCITDHQIIYPVYAQMPREHRINGVHLKFLYPPPDFLDLRHSQKWRNSNNNSLVIKVAFGSISFLFPGDIMTAAENELVQIAGDELTTTVLIAPHHGSRSSSSKVFLDQVQPEVVIISSGRRGRYKFPHPSVLERYAHRGCKIYRTDINGAVHLQTNGRNVSIIPFVASGLQSEKTFVDLHPFGLCDWSFFSGIRQQKVGCKSEVNR
jgi:competence protein ComEC